MIMKRILLLCTGFFYLSIITVFSQEKEETTFLRNLIGVQFNPYVDEQFFDFRNMNTVSALRYGYRITKNITIGMEFYSNFPINISSGQHFDYFHYKIGLLSRYSILSDKRFQIFVEASPYYSHASGKGINSPDFQFSKFGVYAAPGISLYSKGRKISLDLYYKFSNLTFINGNKSVLSYKLNFNF